MSCYFKLLKSIVGVKNILLKSSWVIVELGSFSNDLNIYLKNSGYFLSTSL